MVRRTRIKMCGTTQLADAVKAVELGVDALGFIFVKKSPRYVVPETAKKITRVLPPFLFKIGVFVDADILEVAEIVQYLGLNGVQLHGKETPQYCEKMRESIPSCSLIKAFRVGEHTRKADFLPYEDVVEGFLLDTYVKNVEGGTGLTFDWSLIDNLKLQKSYILAGGLTPKNISLALTAMNPFAVDVNSGVEHAPGQKDHTLLEHFIAEVAESDKGKTL